MNSEHEQKASDPELLANTPPDCASQPSPAQQLDNSTEPRSLYKSDYSKPPAAEPLPDQAPPTPESVPNSERRPRGKIGRLSKIERDQLNFMLRDGFSYPDVIEKLGEAGKNLTPRNVGDWFNGAAYQRWLKDREWIEETRLNQEPALDLGEGSDPGKFNASVLQVAITQLFQALRHLGSGSGALKEKLGGDPEGFARLVHALSRACRETLNLQKYREACAKAAAAQPKRLDPNREISENEHELFARKVENLFKIKLPRPLLAPKTEPPPPPAAPEPTPSLNTEMQKT